MNEVYLADTSVWVDHLRYGNPLFTEQFGMDLLVIHPMVRGELLMGNLADRANRRVQLEQLEEIRSATDHEVSAMVENHRLYGLGLSWIDAHLLASTLITPNVGLWTLDRRLDAVAQQFGRSAKPLH